MNRNRRGIRESISGAVEAQVNRNDDRRVGNTRFFWDDGIGGMAKLEHDELPLTVSASPHKVTVYTRVEDMEIDIDYETDFNPADGTHGSQRPDSKRIGNTRFYWNDGTAGMATMEHSGLPIRVRVTPGRVDVKTRVMGLELEVNHDPERDPYKEASEQKAVRPQMNNEIVQTFEADDSPPRGLMGVWELGEYRGELRYLRYPDTDEPYDSPWHVKVIGPNRRGRVEPLWSISKPDRKEAVEQMQQKIRSMARR